MLLNNKYYTIIISAILVFVLVTTLSVGAIGSEINNSQTDINDNNGTTDDSIIGFGTIITFITFTIFVFIIILLAKKKR